MSQNILLKKLLQSFFWNLQKKQNTATTSPNKLSFPSLISWAQYFLSHHLVFPPSPMHEWLAHQLDHAQKTRGQKMNVLAPRGSAKSTIVTLAYVLRETLESRERYVWIISDTKSQAYAHLENIKIELTENALLAKHYPHATGKGPVWRSGALVLHSGAAIEAYGTGQKIRGRRYKMHRPSLIICDDVQNDNHIFSVMARNKSNDWFHGTLLKAGNVKTNIINLATALHREAIAVQLLANAGWISETFKAITVWPKNMSLWKEWENLYVNTENKHAARDAATFYENNREALNENAKVLWPEYESLEQLMKMRAESGHASFEREKQNSPINPDACEFPESYFDESIWYEKSPTNIVLRVMALDPSKGHHSQLGDYSAFVMVALDENGLMYVDADLKRRPLSDIVTDGVEWYKTFAPHLFGVEMNEFQELLKPDFEEAFLTQKIPTATIWPVTNTTNKKVRIRRLEPLLSTKRLKFKRGSPSNHLLVEQLKSFPIGDHDDGPDALEMAIRMIAEFSRES